MKPNLYKANGIWWCSFNGRAHWGSTLEKAYGTFLIQSRYLAKCRAALAAARGEG